jgi:hypothetical protein
VCRELHEPVYARGHRDSQQKKSSLNHFFYPQSYPQQAGVSKAQKSRDGLFLGLVRYGKTAARARAVEKNDV